VATAGHLPPLLRHPDGRTEALALPPGPLLGIVADADYPAVDIPVVLWPHSGALHRRARRSTGHRHRRCHRRPRRPAGPGPGRRHRRPHRNCPRRCLAQPAHRRHRHTAGPRHALVRDCATSPSAVALAENRSAANVQNAFRHKTMLGVHAHPDTAAGTRPRPPYCRSSPRRS
jgi:hypothetical protein